MIQEERLENRVVRSMSSVGFGILRCPITEILHGWLDPEIEVLGETRLGVMGDRVAAHDEVAHLMNAEQT